MAMETDRTKQRLKARAKSHLLDRCMRIAENLIPGHVEIYDGERCFNLFTYLDALESRLVTELDGRFELDPNAVARFIWCCLCSGSGQDPAGNTFNGCPILD